MVRVNREHPLTSRYSTTAVVVCLRVLVGAVALDVSGLTTLVARGGRARCEWVIGFGLPALVYRPLQARVIFPEILRRFSLTNAQTKAFTDDGNTKMSLLTLFVTSMENYKKLEICRKIDYGLTEKLSGRNR